MRWACPLTQIQFIHSCKSLCDASISKCTMSTMKCDAYGFRIHTHGNANVIWVPLKYALNSSPCRIFQFVALAARVCVFRLLLFTICRQQIATVGHRSNSPKFSRCPIGNFKKFTKVNWKDLMVSVRKNGCKENHPFLSGTAKIPFCCCLFRYYCVLRNWVSHKALVAYNINFYENVGNDNCFMCMTSGKPSDAMGIRQYTPCRGQRHQKKYL